jgi:hypothetical protein
MPKFGCGGVAELSKIHEKRAKTASKSDHRLVILSVRMNKSGG